MLNLMPSGAKLNYLCKGSNFTIKNWPRKSLNKNTDEGANKEPDPIYGTYMLALDILNYFWVCWI